MKPNRNGHCNYRERNLFRGQSKYKIDRRRGADDRERYSGAGSSHHQHEPHHQREYDGSGHSNNWTKKNQDRTGPRSKAELMRECRQRKKHYALRNSDEYQRFLNETPCRANVTDDERFDEFLRSRTAKSALQRMREYRKRKADANDVSEREANRLRIRNARQQEKEALEQQQQQSSMKRTRRQTHVPYHKQKKFNWQQQKQIEQARQALSILTSLNNNQTNTLYKNASFSSLGILNPSSTARSNNPQPSETYRQAGVSGNSKVEVENVSAIVKKEKTASEDGKSEDIGVQKAPEQSHEVIPSNQCENKSTVAEVYTLSGNTDLGNESNENSTLVLDSYASTEGLDTVQEPVLPKLSIIPLALLLREEQSDLVLEKHFEDLKTQFQNTSVNKPSLASTKKIQDNLKTLDSDTLSKKILNRVMTMDRVKIKNVINNPDPKFDAALKLRARKRLREEIRKQLEQFNLSSPSIGKSIGCFEPDEFVDSDHIPETIMDEIRKTFGMKFLEEAGICTGKDQNETPEKEVLPDLIGDTAHIEQESGSNKNKEIGEETEKPKTDLMTRLKNLESIKANHSKHLIKTPIKTEVVSPKQIVSDEIVSINSSSSDNSENSSSSDSGSDSSSSSSSSGSNRSPRKKQKKKKALEDNVVNSFKTLILPYLNSQQRQRFEKKSATGNLGALMYIYNVCLSKISKNKVLGIYEKKTIKKNLKSSNNEEALQFLIKNIKDLFEQDKTCRRNAKVQKIEASKPDKNKTQQKKPSKSNQPILLKSHNEIQLPTKILNEKYSPGKGDSTNSLNQREVEKVRTEDKTAYSAVGGNSNEILPYEGANSSNSNTAKSNFNKSPERELDSVESGNEGNDTRPRSWKSPGEKKCLQPPSAETNQSVYKDSFEITSKNIENDSPRSDFMSGSTDLNLSSPNFNIRQAEDLRLFSLIQQNKLSEAVLNNLKEIDLKLMELHKRRMYIEEMILKLQKDRMEIDLTTMQLQNEKFLIISSSAAQSSVPLTSSQFAQTLKVEPENSGRCNKKKKTSTPSRPPFSTPFSEKLKNRKKRCQRDILLEYTASTLSTTENDLTNIIKQTSPEKLSEHVDDIFQRKKRKAAPRILFQNDFITKQAPSTSKQNLDEYDETEEYKTDPKIELSEEDSIAKNNSDVELPIENSSVPNGRFEGFKMPISQIRVCGEFIIAASEDGQIYKFCWRTKELLSTFAKHRETVTQIFIDSDKFVYSTSLDGYMKKTSVEDIGLEIQSVNVQEPLHTVDIKWDIAFIGSRWGNVFTYFVKKNKLSDNLLCSMDSSIMVLKAVKEGARRILIVSSKGNQINLRDATTGLLLRNIEAPSNLTIYSILLNENILFCGSSKNEIFAYEFETGCFKSSFLCGHGVVAMTIFRKKYIFAGCYDGFVYVLDKSTGSQIGRFPGCGKVILAMDIVGEKFITSSKDGSMQLMDIPKYILALDK